MKPTVLCYPTCGTCQKAEKWLNANGVEYIYRPIKDENPTFEELRNWLKKSKMPISKFFNTSGFLYKEQNMKNKVKTLSEDELLNILATNGMMVKRPILLYDNIVLVGFKEPEWEATFI